jgi:hypothetical protein
MDLQCVCNSLFSGHTTPETKSKFFNSSQINSASIVGEQSADITIMTEEDDKVTLSSDSQYEASLTTYNSKAITNTTYTESKGRLFSFGASRQLNLEPCRGGGFKRPGEEGNQKSFKSHI